MKLVIDASVAVKWIVGDRPGESDVNRGIRIAGRDRPTYRQRI